MPQTDLSRRAVVTGLGAVTPIGNDSHLLAEPGRRRQRRRTHHPFRRDRLRRAHRGRGQGLRPDGRHGPQDGAPHEPLHPPGHGRRQGSRRGLRAWTSATGTPSGGIASPSREHQRWRAGAGHRRHRGARDAKGPGQVSPFAIPALSGSMAACQLSMEYGLTGPVITQVAACASSVIAFQDALQHDPARRGRRRAGRRLRGAAAAGGLRRPRQHGRAVQAQRRSRRTPRARSIAIATGSSSARAPASWSSSRRSTRWSAAPPSMCEVVGAALTADAFHISAPEPTGRGAPRAMPKAHGGCGPGPDELDYVVAHGTSTPLNDVTETRAIKAALGDARVSGADLVAQVDGRPPARRGRGDQRLDGHRRHPRRRASRRRSTSTTRTCPSATSTTCPTWRARPRSTRR